MLRLWATVKRVKGTCVHTFATIDESGPVPTERMADAARLEIDEADGAFYLIRLAANGDFAGDTWHETLEDAFGQAEFEYELDESGWQGWN